MSTNSANQLSMEDNGSVTETPPQSMQKCTRGSPCSRPDCISCKGPVNNGHVCILTDDLEVTPVKPTTPPDHWIIKLTTSFKEAIQNQYPNELEMLVDRYKQSIEALSINELNYNRTNIKNLTTTPLIYSPISANLLPLPTTGLPSLLDASRRPSRNKIPLNWNA